MCDIHYLKILLLIEFWNCNDQQYLFLLILVYNGPLHSVLHEGYSHEKFKINGIIINISAKNVNLDQTMAKMFSLIILPYYLNKFFTEGAYTFRVITHVLDGAPLPIRRLHGFLHLVWQWMITGWSVESRHALPY